MAVPGRRAAGCRKSSRHGPRAGALARLRRGSGLGQDQRGGERGERQRAAHHEGQGVAVTVEQRLADGGRDREADERRRREQTEAPHPLVGRREVGGHRCHGDEQRAAADPADDAHGDQAAESGEFPGGGVARDHHGPQEGAAPGDHPPSEAISQVPAPGPRHHGADREAADGDADRDRTAPELPVDEPWEHREQHALRGEEHRARRGQQPERCTERSSAFGARPVRCRQPIPLVRRRPQLRTGGSTVSRAIAARPGRPAARLLSTPRSEAGGRIDRQPTRPTVTR